MGELLLRSGVLTAEQLDLGLREQARTGVRLGQILVDHALIEEVTLYDALAHMLKMDRFDLRTAILDKNAMNTVTSQYATEKGLIPFRIEAQNRAIHVAISDPTNYPLIDELTFKLGYRVKLHVASETEVQRIIRHHFHGDTLDRDPKNVNRPSGKRQTGDLDPETLEVQMDRQPVVETLGDPEARALAELQPLLDTQDESARVLRGIFELCVARGIISRQEYLERLRRA